VGILDDMLKVLDRIPGWKRLQQIPTELEELKTRVAALEEKLGGKWPADVCRYCGQRALRLHQTYPIPDMHGLIVEDWQCDNCKRIDNRRYTPGSR
jgi:hypothetical protein